MRQPGRSVYLIVLLSVVISACAVSGGASANWRALFDGRSLQGWTRIGDANWRIEDGNIRADDGTGRSFLLSNEAFRDFRLRIEFRPGSETNSGIYIRCGDRHNLTPDSCYEINIADGHPNKAFRTGSIVKLTGPEKHVETANRWNTFLITAEGPSVNVMLNGSRVAAIHNAELRGGFIALQYGEGDIRFRKVKVESMTEEE